MLSSFRLVMVYGFFLIIISVRGLIAQQNGLSPSSESYLDDVQKFYESVLEDDSTDYDALTNLGVIYQQIGDLEKSLSFFKKTVKFYPQKARAYHNLGILYSLMNRFEDAVINLNKAAELDTTSPNSIRQLGIIYLQNEKFNEAIESFNLALIRNYLDTESRIGKAIAYWSLKDYDKVITEISEMQSLGLQFNRMELLLADVYFKKKDYKNAMKYAKLDKVENSSQAEGHYLLGVLFKMNGEKDRADFEFEEAFSIAKQNKNASLKFDVKSFFKKMEDYK
jgi:tetratricopeptide (TPR) repeat protein